MRRTLGFAELAFGLSILLCATATHAQQQIRIKDDQGNPVRNAEVIIDCDGTKRQGVSDVDGLFSWRLIAGPTQCALIITSAATETHADVLDIPAASRVNRVIVLKQKPESLAKKGCPPDQLRRDGSCSTPDKAREIDALDKRDCPEPLLMRYGLCVPPERARVFDGLDRGIDCPKPKLLRIGNCVTVDEAREIVGAECVRLGRNWRGASPNNYCVSDAEIVAAEAADDAECARTLPGSRAGWVREATWGCLCPRGYVPGADGKKCVQIKPTTTEPDSVFVGTWNGTGNAKGITLVINKDGTGVFTDTRPGQPPRPNGGKGKWVLDRPGFIVTDIGFGFWFRNGVLVDPWDNIYTK